MAKPALFLIHEDEAVLGKLAADVDRRFDADYRILRSKSPREALATLEQLAATSEEVAVVIAAVWMGEMPGVDLLGAVRELHPGAKRVLLISRGDWTSTHPAIQAMASGQIDAYLFDPWIPLERGLYLPLSEFLADWVTARAPVFEVIRVVGERWDPRSHRLRESLTLTGIPFGFYPVDSEAGRGVLAEVGEDGTRLPILVTDGGEVMVEPSATELAEALGLPTRPPEGPFDLAVIGAGPAGLAAAVYASSEGLRVVVLESAMTGGQAGTSSLIRNYLGFPRGLSGVDLTNRALEQAWLFGADMVAARSACGLRVGGPDRLIALDDGPEVSARAVIIACGVTWRRLGVPALEALCGAGVFYGAAGGEAKALAGGDVFVVGAGNSAGQAAIHLARYAASVTMLVRGTALGASMSDYLVRRIEATPNIAVRLRSEVVDGEGTTRLERLTIAERVTGAVEVVPAAALFVMIGAEPRTDWLDGCVARDDAGYLLTGRNLLRSEHGSAWPLDRPPLLLETSVPGVFAAGDVRHLSVKRVASAVGEGATAVQLVHEYLADRDEARP